jgi:hypothetical protein
MLGVMQVFMFVSDKNAEVCAITFDKTGRTLPRDLAPWRAVGGQVLPVGNGHAVRAIIEQDGYYLVCCSSDHDHSNPMRAN